MTLPSLTTNCSNGDTSAAHASRFSSPVFDVYVRYLCLCNSAGISENGESSWRRRFGCDFAAPLLPFGSLVRFMPPPGSRLRTARTGGTMASGVFIG
eukprot:8306927-Pyramimonas_sp.AAC.1